MPSAHRTHTILFAAFATVVGLLYAVIIPPFQGPDEWFHVYRAWAVSEGELLPVVKGDQLGVNVPGALVSLVRELGEPVAGRPEVKVEPSAIRRALTESRDEGRRFVASPATAWQPFVVYLPQAAAIAAANTLAFPPLAAVYAGRFAQMAVSIAILAIAMRLAPGYRWFLFLLVLAPMSAFLRSVHSPDTLTISVTVLLVTAVVRIATREAAVTPAQWAGVACLAAVLCLCKVVYIPIAFTALLLDRKRFALIGVARARLALVVPISCASAFAAWSGQRYVVAWRPDVPVDIAAQKAHILADPASFFLVLARDIAANGDRYLAQIVGQLGWLDVNLPTWLLVGGAVSFAALLVTDGPEKAVPLRLRAGFAAAVVIATAAVQTSIYLTWTVPGAGSIDGVSGRYFIPLVPVAAFALGFTPRGTRRVSSAVAIVTVIIATAVAASRLVHRYYFEGWWFLRSL